MRLSLDFFSIRSDVSDCTFRRIGSHGHGVYLVETRDIIYDKYDIEMHEFSILFIHLVLA
jgi:hypothetical protein